MLHHGTEEASAVVAFGPFAEFVDNDERAGRGVAEGEARQLKGQHGEFGNPDDIIVRDLLQVDHESRRALSIRRQSQLRRQAERIGLHTRVIDSLVDTRVRMRSVRPIRARSAGMKQPAQPLRSAGVASTSLRTYQDAPCS